MRWVYVSVYEAFLSPKEKAAGLRVTVNIRRNEEAPQTTDKADLSQLRDHGYFLWHGSKDIKRFEVPEPHEAQSQFTFTFVNDNRLRGDEILGGCAMDAGSMAGMMASGAGQVHDVELKLTPTDELTYYNDDGGQQEVYNYRTRVRILVTPAGYDPTPQHRQMLEAPSAKFNPQAERDEDGNDLDEEGMGDKAAALSSELARWPVFRALKLFLFGVIAIISCAITLALMIQEFDKQTDPSWHRSNPEDGKRCVPFFDLAAELKDSAKYTLYNYNLANATVAFCTNRSRTEFDTKLGQNRFYDAAKDVTGVASCSLASLNASIGNGSHPLTSLCDPAATCAAAYLTAPRPYGVMWEYSIKKSETNNVTCATTVKRMDVDWPACDLSDVYVYRLTRSNVVYVIFVLSFIFAWVRLAMEFFGVAFYHFKCCTGCGKNGVESVLFRISFRGLFGPVYYLIKMIASCSTKLPIVEDPPLPVDLTLVLMESLPNIILPIFAIWGCSKAAPSVVILLVFGIVKAVLLLLAGLVPLIIRCRQDKKQISAADENVIAVKAAQ